MLRRPAHPLGAAALVAFVACGDPYLHTNPYDPAYPVAITVSGPDTLFSSFQVATYTAQSTPPFPDSAIHWTGSGTTGRTTSFMSVAPPLWPATIIATVAATIGTVDTTISLNFITTPTTTSRHEGIKQVVLTQRVVRIQLRCPDTHACDTLSAGGVWSVWVDGYDVLGQRIYALVGATANPATGTPIAIFTTRDSTIASVSPVGIRAANVTARKTGTTWIVATRGALLDSLQLAVK